MKLLINILVVAFIFSSCEESPDNSIQKSGLPYLGFHDVLAVDEGDKKAGDTLYYSVPEFNYMNQHAEMISSENLKGKIWVTKFFFSHCRTICPPMNQQMKRLNVNTQDIKDDVWFLSFSIDPERDSVQRLQRHIERNGIEAENWHFFTGNEAATHKLGVEGFNILALADENADGGFAHSEYFALTDREGHIRGLYNGIQTESVDKLEADIRLLLKTEYAEGN